MPNYHVGDTAWVMESGAGWVPVQILRVRGNYYTVKRLDQPVAFGVAGHRLHTEEEYRAMLAEQMPFNNRPPDLH